MQVLNRHQVITNPTDQVQHITEVQAAEVLQEVTELLHLLPSQVIAQALLQEVAAATEVVEVVAEAAALRTREVQAVLGVQEVLVAEVVVVQDHLQAEDNCNVLPPGFQY